MNKQKNWIVPALVIEICTNNTTVMQFVCMFKSGLLHCRRCTARTCSCQSTIFIKQK